jgi:hypothetical protein
MKRARYHLSPAPEMLSTNHRLDDVSFSVAVCIDAKKKSVPGKMFGDAVRPALCV